MSTLLTKSTCERRRNAQRARIKWIFTPQPRCQISPNSKSQKLCDELQSLSLRLAVSEQDRMGDRIIAP
jgi:hypothetical protein